ncbi:MAG: hypothetical protein AAB425_09730, partial [Bdellovibrionota bacterium]
MGILRLAIGYFGSYVLYGVAIKWVTSTAQMNDIEFLAYSTLSSVLGCLLIALALGWHKNQGPTRLELRVLFLSGFCTAIVVPATTLLLAQPVSVMVAMVLMRSGVIILSRIVDSVLKIFGKEVRPVVWQENLAIVFAMAALALKPIVSALNPNGNPDHFDFVRDPVVMSVLTLYLAAYFVRLLIMNYYKATASDRKLNNKGYFVFE